MEYKFDRVRDFKLWDFRIGHATMLISSLKKVGLQEDVRIDIVTRNTYNINLRTAFYCDSIKIEESGRVKTVTFYLNGCEIGQISATSLSLESSKREYNELPTNYPRVSL